MNRLNSAVPANRAAADTFVRGVPEEEEEEDEEDKKEEEEEEEEDEDQGDGYSE